MAGASVVIFTEHGRPRKVEFQEGGVASGTISGLTNATVYVPPGKTPELTLTVALEDFHILPYTVEEEEKPEPPEPVGNANPTMELPVDHGAPSNEPRGKRR